MATVRSARSQVENQMLPLVCIACGASATVRFKTVFPDSYLERMVRDGAECFGRSILQSPQALLPLALAPVETPPSHLHSLLHFVDSQFARRVADL